MTDKTKAKIEAMAEVTSEEIIEAKLVLPLAIVLSTGATPWAEWCERFEDMLGCYCEELGYHGSSSSCTKCKFKEEYRQWLEDVE